MKMSTRKLVYISLLGAVSFVLMATLSTPILPSAQFLRFEPSEIPGLFAAITMGPAAGVIVVLLKDILYLLLRAKSVFGPIGDFAASSVFALTAGMVYRYWKCNKGMVTALAAATIVRMLFMIPFNMLLLPIQFGYTQAKVLNMIVYAITPFNFIKGGINALGFYVIYKVLAKRTVFILDNISRVKS